MKIYLTLFLALCGLTLFAQNLSEEEILSIRDQASSIVFDNYVGPVSEFSTRDQIAGIGRFLGNAGAEAPVWADKYALYRSFQPEIPEGLDGDVLAILEDASVDHIRNLRRILAGYLRSAYGYDEEKARVLAEFITYYNAIYYKNMAYFGSRYKPGVLQHIGPANAGLSTHYSEWPGKSAMVIPVSSGVKSGVIAPEPDTAVLAEPEVIEQMRQEDDKSLELRKDMVEIREEELDEQQQVIDAEQESLGEETRELEETVQEVREELAQAEEGSPEEAALQEEVQELEEQREVLQEKQEALDQKQEELEKEEETVLVMREEIAQDENILKEEAKAEETPPAEAPEEAAPPAGEEPAAPLLASTDGASRWFVLVDRPGDPASFGTLCRISDTGKILEKSAVNSIRGNYAVAGDRGVVVIAGKEDAAAQVKAFLMDPETLGVLGESEEAVYAGSRIWTEMSDLYIITRNNSDWVLGKYSSGLELLQTSSVRVNPDTALLFDAETLLIQNSDGTVSVLSKGDLSEIRP